MDTKLMALGEIGALLLAIVTAAGVWMYFNGIWLPSRIIVAFAVMYLAGSYGLRLVHLGRKPDGTSS